MRIFGAGPPRRKDLLPFFKTISRALVLAAAIFFMLAPNVHALHSLTVTATGGLNAQAVLTVMFYSAPTDGGTYYVTWGDGDQEPGILVFGNTTLTWNHTYGESGTYNVQLYKDSTPDGVAQQVTVPFDDTPPTVAITTPGTDPYSTNTTPITISGDASDPDSGITSVSWTNQTNFNTGPATGTTSWTASTVTLGPGTNHIVITATNGAGLQGTDSIDVVYTPPDAVDPVVTIIFPATDPYNTNVNSITVTGTATDNVGVTSMEWMNITNETSGTPVLTVSSFTAGPIPLVMGTNQIRVTAYDAAGNSNTDTVNVIYSILDVQNPVVTITAPTAAATYQTRTSPLPIEGIATDDVGVTQIVWINDQGGSGTASYASPNWDATVNLFDGTNVITVTAADASLKTGSAILTVTYDNTAPTIQITGPTDQLTYITNSPTITLTGDADDGETSVASVTWVRMEDGFPGTAAGTFSWTAAGIPLLPGTNTLVVTATDQLGNQAADQIVVTYDNTSPTVTITTPTALPTYRTAVSPIALSGSALDNLNISQVTWVSDLGSGTATGTTSWSIPSVALQDGTNTITVTVEDEAGNTGTAVLTVTYDTSGPTVTITTPTSSPTYTTSSPTMPLGGTASDDYTSVTSVTWVNSLGGSGAAAGTSSWSVATVNLFNGANVITVTATDELGNTGTDVLTVTYTPSDTTPPSIQIMTPTDQETYTSPTASITMGGTASDDTAVTQVTWASDRGPSGSASGTTAWTIGTVPLSLGDNVITVTAWDAANNTAADVLTVDYSPPDVSDPTVNITTPALDPYYTNIGTLVITGIAADDVSLTEVRWKNDRGGSGVVIGTTSWTATITGLQMGENIITVTAEDWAGKTGTDTVTVVYDPLAPTVTITSPTAAASYDTQSVTIDLSGTALDNYGVYEVLWSSDRGGSGAAAGTASWSIADIPLETGQNIITVTATDATGNTGVDVLTVNPAEFLGPSFAGPFFIGRMELQFTIKEPGQPGVVFNPGSPGQATVPRNFEGLGAAAEITYNASGLLSAEWVVDSQVLGVVNQMLLPGRSEVTIDLPEIPGLPTFDAGIHRVELRILTPSPAFNEPVISYFVTVEEAQPVLADLALLFPVPDASVPLVPGTLQSPNFRWEGLGLEYTYRIELFGPSRTGVVRALPGGGIPPVVAAETPFVRHNLTLYDIGRLLTGADYTWQITARRNGRNEARGGPRTVIFTAPAPLEDAIRIDDLNVTGESGQQLQTLAVPEGADEGGLMPLVRYLVDEPQPLTIIGMVKNESGSDAQNLRVEFSVDGEPVDVSFISYLPAGAGEQVTGVYELLDEGDHEVQVQVFDTEGDGLTSTSVQVGGGGEQTTITTQLIHLIGLRPEQATITTEPIHLIGLRPEQTTITTESIHIIGLRPEQATITTESIHIIGLRPEQATITTTPIHLIGLWDGQEVEPAPGDEAPQTEPKVVDAVVFTMSGRAAEDRVFTTETLRMKGRSETDAIVIAETMQMKGLPPVDRAVTTETMQMKGRSPEDRAITTDTFQMTGGGN